MYAQWEELTEVVANIHWEGVPKKILGETPRDYKIPAVYLSLFRKTKNSSDAERVGEPKLVESNGTVDKVKWSNMDQTDGKGNNYEYYVKQTDSEGTGYVPPNYTTVENKLTVTNYYQYVKVTAIKHWVGAESKKNLLSL